MWVMNIITCTCDKNALKSMIQFKSMYGNGDNYTLQSLVTSHHVPSSMDQKKAYIITGNCYMMVFALYGMSGMCSYSCQ